MALGRIPKYLPIDEIVSRYLAGESEAFIAESLNVGRTTIHRRLLSQKVDLRTAIEARALQTRRSFSMTEDVLNLVDGLLLGDAWIDLDGNSEGRLCIEQRIGGESWLCSLKSELRDAGIESFSGTRKSRTSCIQGRSFIGGGCVYMRTGKYCPFSKQRHRWYPQGKKRVPLDVNLGPKSLAHWYWGDGSTSNPGYKMVFHTEGFVEDDVRLLQRRLSEKYGWSPTIQERKPGQFILVVQRREDRVALVSLIKPFCPTCFEYKLIIKE